MLRIMKYGNQATILTAIVAFSTLSFKSSPEPYIYCNIETTADIEKSEPKIQFNFGNAGRRHMKIYSMELVDKEGNRINTDNQESLRERLNLKHGVTSSCSSELFRQYNPPFPWMVGCFLLNYPTIKINDWKSSMGRKGNEGD